MCTSMLGCARFVSERREREIMAAINRTLAAHKQQVGERTEATESIHQIDRAKLHSDRKRREEYSVIFLKKAPSNIRLIEHR